MASQTAIDGGRRLDLSPAMLFVLGSVSLLLFGALGRILPPLRGIGILDVYYHDTYVVLASTHVSLGLAALLLLLGFAYYVFPMIFRRRMNESLGRVRFALTFGSLCALLALLFLQESSEHFALWAGLVLGSAFVGAQAILAVNFFWSLWKGKKLKPGD